MKKFHVAFTFHEMPSGLMYQNVNVEATDLGMAVHHAYKEIRKRPAVKGRRLTTAKITIVEVNNNRALDDA